MAFQVAWSKTAADDLREIVQFIAMDHAEAAAKLADQIIHHIEAAANMPLSSRVVPEKNDSSVCEVILRPYRIIIHVDDSNKRLHVLRIWHGGRGTPEIAE